MGCSQGIICGGEAETQQDNEKRIQDGKTTVREKLA